MKTFVPALRIFVVLTVLTGFVYPLVVTVISQVAFSHQANGSLIKDGDKTVGSELIGQAFEDPKYFLSRPSATTPQAYNAASSGGSNLAPTSADLKGAIQARVAAIRAYAPDNSDPVPTDLVTASGSGLDPHISLAAAAYQVDRVAKVRGLSPDRVKSLVSRYTQGRQFGVLGEPVVNVLELNRALDKGE